MRGDGRLWCRHSCGSGTGFPPRVAAQLRAARSSRIRSRPLIRLTASRMSAPVAWARTSRPFRSRLTWAIAGRSTAGSAAIVSFTRANSTGSEASRSSERTLRTATSAASAGTAPWASVCT